MIENIHLAKEAKIFYTTGYFVSVNLEAVMIAAKYAIENNKPFALNLSAGFIV